MPISNHSEIISQHLFVKLVNHCCQLGYILVKENNKRITHVKYFFVVCVRVLIITLQLAVMQKTRLCLDSCSILKLFTFIQFNDMYYGQCMIELTWTIFKNSLSNEGEKKNPTIFLKLFEWINPAIEISFHNCRISNLVQFPCRFFQFMTMIKRI